MSKTTQLNNPRRIGVKKNPTQTTPRTKANQPNVILASKEVLLEIHTKLRQITGTSGKDTHEFERIINDKDIPYEAIRNDVNSLLNKIQKKADHVGNFERDEDLPVKPNPSNKKQLEENRKDSASKPNVDEAKYPWPRLENALNELLRSRTEDEKRMVKALQVDITELVKPCPKCFKLESKLDILEKTYKSQICSKDDDLNTEKTKNSESDKTIKQLQERVDILETQLKVLQNDLKTSKETYSVEVGKLRNALKHQNHELQEALKHQKIPDIKKPYVEEVEELKEKMKDYQMRLAAEMSEKVSKDESSFENISIKNRPMNVAAEYEMLCSHAWLNAKSTLDKQLDKYEDKKIELLTQVLLIAEKVALEMLQAAYTWFQTFVKQPLTVLESEKMKRPTDKDKGVPLADGMKTVIGDLFRINADDVIVTFLIKSVQEKLDKSNLKFKQQFTGKNPLPYLTECARLAWKMVIQRPPMTFGVPKEKWGNISKIVDPAWGSTDVGPTSKVIYYRHPILYHGSKVMVKGKAVVK